jgi:formylglycine-generating enzyme required for sulfatase activity/serine/threonine protein kinase
MADTTHFPVFRDYTVISRLGHGGFGSVYKVQHKFTKQMRALKILPPGIQEDAETLKQFQEEAEVMGSFDHPHIVKIYHAGIENGFPFLDMEFVEGESIYHLIHSTEGDKTLEPEEVIRLAREIGDALDYIHRKNWIHRDVKPQNIMRGSDGSFKLMDFGIAFESKLSKRPSEIAGTPEYMSPEQIEGEVMYSQTDLYSFGVVLYEALIGRAPFRSEGMNYSARLKLQQQILEKEPLHLKEYNTRTPAWFADIVMKCLHKRWTDRFETGASLVKAIEEGIEIQRTEADRLLHAANNLANQNQFDEASEKFKEAHFAYQQVLKYVSSHMTLSEQLTTSLRQCEEQIEFLSETGQKVRTLREDAITAFRREDFQVALVRYQEIAEIYPNDSDAKFQIEQCESGIKRQEELRRQEVASVKLQGDTLFGEKRYRAARVMYQKLLDLKPETAEDIQHGEARIKVCTEEIGVYWKQSLEKEAEAEVILKETQAEGYNEGYHRKISALYKEAQHLAELGYEGDIGNLNTRYDILQAKIKATEGLLGAYRELAQTTREEGDRFFANGNYGEAKKRYQFLVKNDPENKRLQDRLNECAANEINVIRTEADSLYGDEKYEEAELLYRSILELKPDDELAQRRLGECVQYNEVNAQVRQLAEQQVKLLVQSGDQLFAGGRYKQALSKYDQAFAQRPDHQGLRQKIEAVNEKLMEGRSRFMQPEVWGNGFLENNSWLKYVLILGLIGLVGGIIFFMDPFNWFGASTAGNGNATETSLTIDGDKMTNSIGLKFAQIPSGTFIMGDPQGDADAQPVHNVDITNSFWMGTTEVTVGEFKKFTAETGYQTEAEKEQSCNVWNGKEFVSDKTGQWGKFLDADDKPMVCVTWNDAQAFVSWLNTKEGAQKYRLPSEAEWEYGARAGTTTTYSFGDAETELGNYGWTSDNAGTETHAVGQKQPNKWGLYDIYGNAYEWTADFYDGAYYKNAPKQDPKGPGGGLGRVLRGGGWAFSGKEASSSYRNYIEPVYRNTNLGFRIVRDL